MSRQFIGVLFLLLISSCSLAQSNNSRNFYQKNCPQCSGSKYKTHNSDLKTKLFIKYHDLHIQLEQKNLYDAAKSLRICTYLKQSSQK